MTTDPLPLLYAMGCDAGGYDRIWMDQEGVEQTEWVPRCGAPPAVRYRPQGAAEGVWGYRCKRHGVGHLADDIHTQPVSESRYGDDEGV